MFLVYPSRQSMIGQPIGIDRWTYNSGPESGRRPLSAVRSFPVHCQQEAPPENRRPAQTPSSSWIRALFSLVGETGGCTFGLRESWFTVSIGLLNSGAFRLPTLKTMDRQKIGVAPVQVANVVIGRDGLIPRKADEWPTKALTLRTRLRSVTSTLELVEIFPGACSATVQKL
jgi:hypothetical protein